MAKTLVVDPLERTRIPFLRGILTRSVQEAGLAFKDAYELASRIRDDLEDTEFITTPALREMVLEYLKTNDTGSAALIYESQGNAPVSIEVYHQDGRVSPFSDTMHRSRLEAVGLSHEQASGVIAKMRKHLLDRGAHQVDSQHIARLTYRYLRLSHDLGPELARRYMVWVDFLRSGRPLILLIGGTAGCGKSTLATEVANRLDIVRMQSTDMLREIMRTMLPEKLLPVLHQSSYSAWKAFPKLKRATAENEDDYAYLAEGFQAQAELLSVASEAVLQRALRERVSMILEGVHIQPSFVDRLPRDADAVVVPLMLAILKRKELQKRIKGRGTQIPQRRAERYLQHFDEIWRLQSMLLSEADRSQIPIIENKNKEKVVTQVMKLIIDTLSGAFSSTPAEVFTLRKNNG